MKLFLTSILILFFASANAQADTITTAQAKDYIGKKVVLKGKLVGFKIYTAKDGKDMIFLDIDAKYPNTLVGVTVFNEALATLKLNKIDINKQVYVYGIIELYREKPTIGIRAAENLKIE